MRRLGASLGVVLQRKRDGAAAAAAVLTSAELHRCYSISVGQLFASMSQLLLLLRRRRRRCLKLFATLKQKSGDYDLTEIIEMDETLRGCCA